MSFLPLNISDLNISEFVNIPIKFCGNVLVGRFFLKKIGEMFGVSEKKHYLCSEKTKKCGNSSVDRALAFQAGGRGFEPRLPLHFLFAVIAQR